jgi:hypothetical protein
MKDDNSEFLNFMPELYENTDYSGDAVDYENSDGEGWEYMGEDGEYEYFVYFSDDEDGDDHEDIDDWEHTDGEDYEYIGEDGDYEYFACFSCSASGEEEMEEDEYENLFGKKAKARRKKRRTKRKARRTKRKTKRKAKKIARVKKRVDRRTKRKTKRISRKIKRVAKRKPTARRKRKVSRLTKRKSRVQKRVPRRVRRLTRTKAPIRKKDVKKLQLINRNNKERAKYISKIRGVRGAKIGNMLAEDYFAKKMGITKPSRNWSAGELKKIYSYASKENILMEANKNKVAMGVYEANRTEINEPYADWYVKNRMAFKILQDKRRKRYSPRDFGNYLSKKYKKTEAKLPENVRSQRKKELQETADRIRQKERQKAEKIKAKVDSAVTNGQDVDEVDTDEVAITVPDAISKPKGYLDKALDATDNIIYKFFKFFKL